MLRSHFLKELHFSLKFALLIIDTIGQYSSNDIGAYVSIQAQVAKSVNTKLFIINMSAGFCFNQSKVSMA